MDRKDRRSSVVRGGCVALAAGLLLLSPWAGIAHGSDLFPVQTAVVKADFTPWEPLSNSDLSRYRGGDVVIPGLVNAARQNATVAVVLWDELQKAGRPSRGAAANGGMAVPGRGVSGQIAEQAQATRNLVPIMPQKTAH